MSQHWDARIEEQAFHESVTGPSVLNAVRLAFCDS